MAPLGTGKVCCLAFGSGAHAVKFESAEAHRKLAEVGWWPVRPGSVSAFAFALGCVSISTLVRGIVDPLLPPDAISFVTYFPALLFATFWGGVRVGAFALLVSLSASWWLFLSPRYSIQLSPSNIWSVVTFILSGALMVWGAHHARRFSNSLSQEISRHRITTKRLQASEETLRLAMHASKLAILDYDAVADVVSYWNPELYATTNLAPSVTIGLKEGLAFVHPEDRERIAAKVQQALDSRGSGDLDEEFRVKGADNGETRWVHMLYETRFSGEGEARRPSRGNGVLLDITARKDAEAEAERQRNELTHLMRVATVGGLSGGIAHELNQPLASILSNAEAAQVMLAKENLDREEFGNILEEIVQEDRRAGEVIRRLRSLLKKGQSEPSLINVSDKIASTVGLLHSEFVIRGIKVKTDLEADLPTISGDRVQLQQVFLNLMINAMDAMTSTPPSERALSIRTRSTKEGCIEVSITDRGPGIPPEELNRIREPFFTTKKGGLGLGLSISSAIVESHHGRLTLSNASDGGIVATVSLPTVAQLAAAS